MGGSALALPGNSEKGGRNGKYQTAGKSAATAQGCRGHPGDPFTRHRSGHRDLAGQGGGYPADLVTAAEFREPAKRSPSTFARRERAAVVFYGII